MTRIMLARMNYTWTVSSFSLMIDSMATGQFVESSRFSPPDAKTHKFSLVLFPKGETKEVKDHVSLYMYYRDGWSENVNLDLRFRLLNSQGLTINDGLSLKNYDLKKGNNIGWIKYISQQWIKDPKNQALSSLDQITLLVEFTIYIGSNIDSGQCRTVLRESPAERMSWDMYLFLGNGKYSDMTLLVKGAKIRTHKFVLAARSPTFKSLLDKAEQDIQKAEPVITIDHIDPLVMLEVLKYIYTGGIRNLEIQTRELLHAANELELVGLKEMCEMQLCLSMRMDNAYEMLRLSVKYRADGLRLRSAKFIAAHFSEISRMPSLLWHQDHSSGCISSALYSN